MPMDFYFYTNASFFDFMSFCNLTILREYDKIYICMQKYIKEVKR